MIASNRHPTHRHAAGFTLLELIVVSSILLTAVLVGLPALLQAKRRAELVNATNEVLAQLRQARQEAVQMGVPVVARADPDTRQLVIFANVDQDTDLSFDPDESKPHRTVDYSLGDFILPGNGRLLFQSPGGGDPADGFTTDGASNSVIVFQPKGSIRDAGALRVSDLGLNHLEIRIARTGKMQIMKYNPNPAWGGDPGFYPNMRHQGTNMALWQWY